MHRTTIMLPLDLKFKAVQMAQKMGISFGEFVRETLKKAIRKTKNTKSLDPFFADKAVFRGKVPKDLSERHDDYLYGDDA
ncbi:MAG: hypothetical protein HYS07_05990 [Chlamydiae bacterium]|nr:hypothetical protein [Chlamydiota bacterium]MBI3277243.1 hypothetical protein [Chlamydiota bacterium]